MDYLTKTGWIDSFRAHASVDGSGAPIPWITYPAIYFLKTRNLGGLKVFEYGSGSSTFWWIANGATVASCEHDPRWYRQMRGQLPESVSYRLCDVEDGNKRPYAEVIKGYKSEFQVVIIDGVDRVNCALNCVEALTDDGVVIWDNTDREEYGPGLDFLTEKGFRRLDFHGLGPVMTAASLTTIFYRPNNCLKI